MSAERLAEIDKLRPVGFSPGEWRVLEVMDKKFVATPAYEGHPYTGHTRFVDVAGDEDYPKREADLALIAAAPTLLQQRDELLREVERLRESTSFPRPVTQDCLNPFEALLASGRDTITSSAIRAIVDTIRPRLLALEARADSAVTDHQQQEK